MRLSVLIPTHGRPKAIERCLDALARVGCASPFEVLVGLDGAGDDTPHPAVPHAIADRTRILPLERVGIVRVRRALTEAARGEILLWLNDDVVAEPGLLDAHLAMHDASDATRVVGGEARWAPVESPDLFDRIVQETDLVFFSPPDPGAEAPYRVDYRNCFGLNMSFPRQAALDAEGVPDIAERYGYEDIELVHRLVKRVDAEVWRAPGAVVTHHHRYRPEDVHRREYLLGRAAWAWAHANPSFGRDLFRCDLRSHALQSSLADALYRERRDAERIERTFMEFAGAPAESASGVALRALAEHWVVLKRWLWRWGFLDVVNEQPSRWSFVKDAPSDVDRLRRRR